MNIEPRLKSLEKKINGNKQEIPQEVLEKLYPDGIKFVRVEKLEGQTLESLKEKDCKFIADAMGISIEKAKAFYERQGLEEQHKCGIKFVLGKKGD